MNYALINSSNLTAIKHAMYTKGQFGSIQKLDDLGNVLVKYVDGKLVVKIGDDTIIQEASGLPLKRIAQGEIPDNAVAKKLSINGETAYNIYSIDADGKLVPSRDNREAFSCSHCGETSFGTGIHDPHAGQNDRRVICQNCLDRLNSQGIKRWSYKPAPEYRGIDNIFFGTEVEMECRTRGRDNYGQEALAVTAAMNDLVYCKSDSSIHGGFETVTHPFTLDYARNSGEISRMFDVLAENNMVGGAENDVTSCGITSICLALD